MRSVALILMFGLGAPAAAQLPKGEFPPGFTVSVDEVAARAADVIFVSMSPGWHVTTGPAAIMYSVDSVASGNYRVDSESFLFDPGQRNEGYGIFFGGNHLIGGDQQYTYFLIRRSGEFLVKRRRGTEAVVLIDWTRDPSILRYDDKGEAGTAKNVLSVDAGADTVRFLINDKEVASLPRNRVDADGVVGLRVNHALDVHVSSLKITRRH